MLALMLLAFLSTKRSIYPLFGHLMASDFSAMSELRTSKHDYFFSSQSFFALVDFLSEPHFSADLRVRYSLNVSSPSIFSI